jgi:hypothetical protein
MRVNENRNPLFLGFKKNFFKIIYIGFVINAGTGMFQGFPGNNKTDKCKTPVFKLFKVSSSIFQGKRTPNK